MNYLSVTQTAEKWDMTQDEYKCCATKGRRRVLQRVGNVWTIPENAENQRMQEKVINKK